MITLFNWVSVLLATYALFEALKPPPRQYNTILNTHSLWEPLWFFHIIAGFLSLLSYAFLPWLFRQSGKRKKIGWALVILLALLITSSLLRLGML